MNELSITQLVGAGLSILSPLVTIFVLWKVGVIGKKNGNGSAYSQRIQELEEFKVQAEENHFHSLDNLQQSVDKLWEEFNNFRVHVENRITKLEK